MSRSYELTSTSDLLAKIRLNDLLRIYIKENGRSVKNKIVKTIGVDPKTVNDFIEYKHGGTLICDSLAWFWYSYAKTNQIPKSKGEDEQYKPYENKLFHWLKFREETDALGLSFLEIDPDSPIYKVQRANLRIANYIGVGIDEPSKSIESTTFFISSYRIRKNRIFIKWLAPDGTIREDECKAWRVDNTLISYKESIDFRFVALANIGDGDPPDQFFFSFSLILEGSTMNPYSSVALAILVKGEGEFLKPKRKLRYFDKENLVPDSDFSKKKTVPSSLLQRLKSAQTLLRYKGHPIYSDVSEESSILEYWVGTANDLESEEAKIFLNAQLPSQYTVTCSLSKFEGYGYVEGFITFVHPKKTTKVITRRIFGDSQLKDHHIMINCAICKEKNDDLPEFITMSSAILKFAINNKSEAKGIYHYRQKSSVDTKPDENLGLGFGVINMNQRNTRVGTLNLHCEILSENFKNSGKNREYFLSNLEKGNYYMSIDQ